LKSDGSLPLVTLLTKGFGGSPEEQNKLHN